MSLFQEKRDLKIVINEKEYESEAFLQEKDNRNCQLTLKLPNETISIEAESFFDCLCEIKRTYPNILIQCKGYKKNVYPSRMTQQMGLGLKAYEMQMGRQATFDDLVCVFDFENQNLTASNDEQIKFYQKWLNSFD